MAIVGWIIALGGGLGRWLISNTDRNMTLMHTQPITVGRIPAILYGDAAARLFIYVHGRHASKEEAARFAGLVVPLGYQVLSFDLPEHGERQHEGVPCTMQNGVQDLCAIYAAVKDQYAGLSLFACSLGAYFSLLSYGDAHFQKCLFLSPLLDMARLVHNMMQWAQVSEAQLFAEKTIATPFGETLVWDEYDYIKSHPIRQWNSPTSILYGDQDNLTERAVLDAFAQRFHCAVAIMPGGEHYFHTPEQQACLDRWVLQQCA